MPNRRAERLAAMGRDDSPADVQLTRAFIAVALGLLLTLWVLAPECTTANARSMIPEFHALAGSPTLVI